MSELDTQEWTEVNGHPNFMVSNLGDVFNVRKVKRPYIKIDLQGYPYIRIVVNKKAKDYYLHRLVALHFINNPENKKSINHINGNKMDARQSNLEWCTHSENMQHAIRTGLKGFNRCIEVFDKETGIFYESISHAAVAKCLNPKRMRIKIMNGKSSVIKL